MDAVCATPVPRDSAKLLGNLRTGVRLSSTRLADFSSSGQLLQILHKHLRSAGQRQPIAAADQPWNRAIEWFNKHVQS